jgi:hypothetical protein
VPRQADDAKPLLFPAFRSYLAARETINDELMALVAGAAIADATLSGAPQDALLPSQFPALTQLERMNQPVGSVRALWARSPGALARTAFSYIVSVYAAFLADAVVMLQHAGLDNDSHEPDDTHVKSLHERFSTSAGILLPGREVSLFELIRKVRNRLMHQAGTPGAGLGREWRYLTEDAKAEWCRVAGRPFTDTICARNLVLDLQLGELNAALAVTHRLAHRVNDALRLAVDEDVWATWIVDDYRDLWPRKFGDASRRLGRLQGYSRHLYGPLSISQGAFERALQ